MLSFIEVVRQWLNPREESAWRNYRRMFTLLEARLASELTHNTGLSMADYTVLSNLVEAEDRRWRVTALADYMQWSQSRLSHQIRRMESRGLVKREDVDLDGRGSAVAVTRAGLRAIAEAAPVHFEGVRRHMIDLLTPDELAHLDKIAETIVEHLSHE